MKSIFSSYVQDLLPHTSYRSALTTLLPTGDLSTFAPQMHVSLTIAFSPKTTNCFPEWMGMGVGAAAPLQPSPHVCPHINTTYKISLRSINL